MEFEEKSTAEVGRLLLFFLLLKVTNNEKIVAKTMDCKLSVPVYLSIYALRTPLTATAYLLYGKVLKVKMVPKEQVHENLFKGANRRFKVRRLAQSDLLLLTDGRRYRGTR